MSTNAAVLNFPQRSASSPHPTQPPNIIRFHVFRHEDVHGNSGCGVVAEGVIFTSGKCVMTWLNKVASIAIFESIAELIEIHGHGGKTVVIQW